MKYFKYLNRGPFKEEKKDIHELIFEYYNY